MNEAVNRAVNTVRLDAEDIERALLRFIGEEIAADGGGLGAEENLIETGRIDSLGLLHLLSFIESRYHVDLMGSGNPRDLRSVSSLAAAIRREGTGEARAEHA